MAGEQAEQASLEAQQADGQKVVARVGVAGTAGEQVEWTSLEARQAGGHEVVAREQASLDVVRRREKGEQTAQIFAKSNIHMTCDF